MTVTVCHGFRNGHFGVVEVEVESDGIYIPQIVVCDDGHQCVITDEDYDIIRAEAEERYFLEH